MLFFRDFITQPNINFFKVILDYKIAFIIIVNFHQSYGSIVPEVKKLGLIGQHWENLIFPVFESLHGPISATKVPIKKYQARQIEKTFSVLIDILFSKKGQLF